MTDGFVTRDTQNQRSVYTRLESQAETETPPGKREETLALLASHPS